MSRCINLAQALQPSCDVAFAMTADAAPHWLERLRKQKGSLLSMKDSRSDKDAVMVLDGYELRSA